MIHHDVGLHGDELLPVELSEVKQRQLIKLLEAEQNLPEEPERHKTTTGAARGNPTLTSSLVTQNSVSHWFDWLLELLLDHLKRVYSKITNLFEFFCSAKHKIRRF